MSSVQTQDAPASGARESGDAPLKGLLKGLPIFDKLYSSSMTLVLNHG